MSINDSLYYIVFTDNQLVGGDPPGQPTSLDFSTE